MPATTLLGRAVAQRARQWLDAPVVYEINESNEETPNVVRAAVQQAMADHKCDHYTRRPGIAPLCQAVAAQMASHGVDVSADDGVVITGGVREARYVALHALAPGRPVYVAQPGPDYPQSVLALAGIEAQPIDGTGDLPDATDALLLLQPGKLDESARARLAAWIAANDVTCIADETDADFFAGGATSPFASRPNLAERTLTLGSFGFLPVLDNWQVAWFAGPKQLAQTVRDLKQAMTICSPAPAQYAALAAVQSYALQSGKEASA